MEKMPLVPHPPRFQIKKYFEGAKIKVLTLGEKLLVSPGQF